MLVIVLVVGCCNFQLSLQLTFYLPIDTPAEFFKITDGLILFSADIQISRI